MQNRILLSLTFLFFILITALSINIPFFWDGTFFSASALHFFENGFQDGIAPKELDTGGFPMYSFYLAMAWKVFSKSLAVSHLALLPVVLGMAYEYLKLANRFLKKRALIFAVLLLFFEPTLITQTILIGYDLLLVYFFLLALNALLAGKSRLYILAFTLLCLSNVRGAMLGLSLLFIDLTLVSPTLKTKFQKSKTYFIPFIILSLWTVFHYYKTGWWFISPEREHTHEALLPVSMMLHQLLFIFWKIADFGRVALWLFFFVAGYYLFQNKFSSLFKTLLKIIFIPLIILSVFMIPIANPIGQKYFIVIFLVLNIGVCFLIQEIKTGKWQLTIISCFCIALVSGNFWLYPERFGNGWDSSLKVIPYFHLQKEMDAFIKNNNISPADIGTQFPLIADKRVAYLSDTSYCYNNVWSGPIGKFRYFLYTNIINTDISQQVNETKQKWELIKGIHSGQVYINLYKRPD